MSYTVSLQQRIQQLKKAQADLPSVLYRVQKKATLRAIEAAQDATPPKADTRPLHRGKHDHGPAESALGLRQPARTRSKCGWDAAQYRSR